MGKLDGTSFAQLTRALSDKMEKEFLDFYVPHDGQAALHSSNCKEKWGITANRWGKTTALLMEMLWHITRQHPCFTPKDKRIKGHWAFDWPEWTPVAGKQRWRLVCNDTAAIVRYMLPKIEAMVPRRFLYQGSWEKAWNKRHSILLFADGSVLQFLTYEQKVQAHEGETLHGVAFDEEPPEDIYTVNVKCLATTNGLVLGAMTPWQSSRFVYQDVYLRSQTQPEDVLVARGIIEENPYISKEAVRRISDQITDPNERAARLKGEFAWLTGVVFPAYKRDVHFVPYPAEGLPDEWPIVMAIDPHPNKPTAVTWTKFDLTKPDRPTAWVYREAFLRGTVEEIANMIRVQSVEEQMDTMLIDSHVLHPDTLRGTASLMVEWQSLLPGLMPAPADKMKRINALKEYIHVDPISQKPRLFVTHNCPATHWQIERYHWKGETKTGEELGKPQTIRRDDDCTDCVGYTVQVGPKKRRRPSKGAQIVGFSGYGKVAGERTF